MSTPAFDAALFAHGRLLWRHAGSEAARFSPRLALAMVEQAACIVPRGTMLWDPFCGTGLVPAVAIVYARPPFDAVLASDLDPTCAATAARNLALVSEPETARIRLRELRGRMGRNTKSLRRWGEVARYLEALLPTIAAIEASGHQARACCAPADPGLLDGRPASVLGDAPYGRATQLEGDLAEIVRAWLQSSVVWIDLVCTQEQAEEVCRALPRMRWHRARGGRARLRFGGRAATRSA